MQPQDPYTQQPGQPGPQPQYPEQPVVPDQNPYNYSLADPNQAQHTANYDFIMNPERPKRSFSLPGGGSLLIKLAYAAGALLVLVIVLTLGKNLFGSKPSLAPLLSVAQDQTAIIQILKDADQVQGLSTTNANFIATSNPVLATDRNDLLGYMKANHLKVKQKQLVLKVAASTGTRLTAASDAGTYNDTFKEVMNTQLTTYERDLTTAFNGLKGPKGRALLQKDYKNAELLKRQLNTEQ